MDRLCRHFGECGGCLYQNVPYPDQVRMKSEQMGVLFRPFWAEPISVEPSPAIWHYRNKVDFSFARKWYETPPPKDFERESVLGFKTRGKWFKPLEVHDCRIGPEGLEPLLDAVREWMQAENLQAFDTRTRRGFLKILMVREGKRTAQRMVVLTTADGDFDKACFVRAVLDAFPADSVFRGIYRGFADVAIADEVKLLHGSPTIEEQLHLPAAKGEKTLRFQISPFSFFQTNTLATGNLYAAIRRMVEEVRPSRLYDLYGGAGGIAMTCADLVNTVYSVESISSATEDGLRNVQLNGVENIDFLTAKVEDYLKTSPNMADAIAIVDPPRAGLHPKALARLLELAPAQMIYVSCNPKILASELPVILEKYTMTHLQAFDLFPHTPHVEVLVRMTRA